MHSELIHEQACQVLMALKLPRRSNHRYWAAGAAKRELAALLELDGELRHLRATRRGDLAEFAQLRAGCAAPLAGE